MIWALGILGAWVVVGIAFLAGYGLAATSDFRRNRRGGYVR